MKTDRLTYSFLALREKLHRSAMKFLADDEDARDALQDAYFRLRRAGGVDTDAEARNKLFTVLRNLCIDRLRRRRLKVAQEEIDAGVDPDPDPPEDMERLEALLSSGLSATQRRVYACIVRDGLEYEETAERLGMTVESVRVNMSRTRKKIRENYKILNR